MLHAVLGAVAGYAVATLIALTLDLAYSGAPLRRPALLRARHGGFSPLWLGTFGFLLAHGRDSAGNPLPVRLCYLPLLGAAAGAAVAVRASDVRAGLLPACFAAVLLALTGTDFERHVLPNRLLYPALAAAILLGWAWPGRTWLSSIEGGAISFAIMFACFAIVPPLGFGDVKLAALLGLLSGAGHVLPALAAGIIAGGVAALLLLITHRAGRKSLIAYGPYLALGAFAGMLRLL